MGGKQIGKFVTAPDSLRNAWVEVHEDGTVSLTIAPTIWGIENGLPEGPVSLVMRPADAAVLAAGLTEAQWVAMGL